MTLAHLYDQIKGVVGDSDNNLSQEIDDRIKNQEEVIAARKGHDTLLQKVNAIDQSVDGSSSEIMELSGRINETESDIVTINEEIEAIRTANPTIEMDNGNHLLVQVDKRPSHKSTNFSLNANEQYRTHANTEHYVSQLFVRDNIHNKEIDMAFKNDNSEYDKTINHRANGSLTAIQDGEMTLPLHLSVIANQSFSNIAILPEICDIQGITNSTYVNESNHIVSAFRKGYQWHVKSKMVDMLLKFVKPVFITTIDFDFTANTQSQSATLFEFKNNNWVELSTVPSTDGKFDVYKELGFIKIRYTSLSSSENTFITVKDVEIHTRKYHASSGVTKVTEQVDLYDLSGHATFAPIVDIPTDTICKFAISASDSDESYAYYPSRRMLESGLFTNVYGMKVIDKIKSSINRNYIMDYLYQHLSPVGTEGYISITSKSWSEDTSLTLNGGYPIDNLSYLNLQVKVRDTVRTIAIGQSWLNKITNIIVDGASIDVQVKKVRSGIKIGVVSDIPLSECQYVISSLQNLYTSGDGTSVRPADYSSTSVSSVSGFDFIKQITAAYSARKNLYRWESGWPWWGAWVSNGTTYSKYNQTTVCSIIAIDTDKPYANPATHTRNSSNVQYDTNTFAIRNARSSLCYVGVGDEAYGMYLDDGQLIAKDIVTQISPCNEFIGCMKRDIKQKVVRMQPHQEVDRLDDVEYFISYNNYNFYTYNHDNNSWNQTKDGMSLEDVVRIPSYAYEKLLTSENIYFKIKVNSSKAEVSGIEVGFDKDSFKSISGDLIPIYGMNLTDIKDISASFILELINKLSTLSVLMVSESKLPCWRYLVPGIQLIEYGGISWNLTDQSIATQHISGNMLIIKNVSKEIKHFKLEQKYFEDNVVVVGDMLQNQIFEDAIEHMDSLDKNVNDMVAKVDILDQNIQLLHDALQEGTKPPQELPSYIIPAQIEKDLEPLAPGDTVEIPQIKNLRYVQYWDTQKHPIPEFVEHKTVKNLTHHFIYENGVFTPTHFEMDRWYDTDNAYLMSRGLISDSMYSYRTSDYTCTAIRSDGVNQNPRSSANIGKMLSGPENNYSGWSWSNWRSDKSNIIYDMPGEAGRWMDFDFTFNQETYIHGLLNCDWGAEPGNGPEGHSSDRTNYSHQITTIFLDYDGSGNWVKHSEYASFVENRNIYINKPLKKMRIRIEVPYSHNRGAARVSLKYIDIYHCPTRYLHDVDAKLKPILYYNTETWKRLMSVYSDATIAGTGTDIHYLFETNNKLQNDKKYWGFNGSKLVEKSAETYANGMLLQQFNNLTEAQLLPLLKYDYVRPIAILDTVDGHRTPLLRTLRMNYAEKEYETTTLLNPQDINTRYDKEAEKLIVTNATKSNKTLKAIIS